MAQLWAILGLASVTYVIVSTEAHNLDRIGVDPTNNWFLDSFGRVRIFHGINSVQKGVPWYEPALLDNSRMKEYKRFGLNFMRLGSMWAGVEPVEGQYNSSYMAILDDIVRRLADHGVYTMLDMHQDLLTSRDGINFDGVPRWLVDKFPPSPQPYPWPLKEIEFWEQGYLTKAVSFWFQLWYKNYHGTADQWVDFWGHLAQHYTGRPEVIGYNLINEPWVGDYLEDPGLLLPGNAGRRHLQHLYDSINRRIRRYDHEGIIFYEPVFHGQAFDGPVTGSGFDHVPGGFLYRNVSAYSFHMYCWALEFIERDADDATRAEAVEFCNNRLLPKMLDSQQSNVRKTGGASLLTEFGVCRTWEDRVDVECNTFMDLCDKYLIGWVDWDHADHLWFHNGQVVEDKVADYVRTYARAIAGIPSKMHYDRHTHHFSLIYEANPQISAPTEIFVPQMHYQDGFHVDISGPDATYQVQDEDQVVLVTYTGRTPVHLTVTITPN